MHGKAVALFDFERENENELPLVEGQVLWVSYRHGQGWLVAQDPKSGESGLVPEEYVRLVKDIQGGLNGLNGQFLPGGESPTAAPDTPTGPPAAPDRPDGAYSGKEGNNQSYVPVVSHFSTSSKDLKPYPQRLFGSQANTPTAQLDRQLHTPSIEEEEEETSEEPSTESSPQSRPVTRQDEKNSLDSLRPEPTESEAR